MLNQLPIHQLKRWSFMSLLLALVCQSPSLADSMPSLTQSIQAEQLHIEITRTGRIDFRYVTHLSFKTPGFVEQLFADVGQRIVMGDTLGTIELDDLKAAQASANASYEKAVQDVVRARKLFKEKKTVSKDFLEQAETALIRARSALNQADYDLSKARIETPFDAVVLERLVQPGEQVQAGIAVFSVAAVDAKNLIVRLNLTQQEISKIQLYSPASIVLADQKQVSGHIISMSATAEPNTGLYEVEIALDLAGHSAFPGQWVRTTLNITSPQQSYRIPMIALAGITNGKANFVILDQGAYQLHAFDMLYMDQQFIYVPAMSGTIQVVTRGWERLLTQLSQ